METPVLATGWAGGHTNPSRWPISGAAYSAQYEYLKPISVLFFYIPHAATSQLNSFVIELIMKCEPQQLL